MPKLRVHSFAISVEGYGAGPNQDLANPLGVGGVALHEWAFATRTFRLMFGQDGGTTDTDDEFAARGFNNIGAWIIGRNMFGPIRGSWPDENWKGWWGDNPPYRTPVGGVATIQQYLRAGLIDEMHLAISPILLGSGEHLLAGIDAPNRPRCRELGLDIGRSFGRLPARGRRWS